MDYNNQENNEALFGARNENSVLFSLDSLNSLDEDNNDGGLNTNSEASGLINLDMLNKMSHESSSDEDGIVANPMNPMGSMVFNQVIAKKSKRNIIFIIVGFVVVIALGVAGAYWVYHNAQKEKEAMQASEEKARMEAAAKAEEDEAAVKAELEKSQQEQENKDKEIAELKKMIADRDRENQLREQAKNDASDVAAANAANKKPSSGKPSNSGTGTAAAAPAKPSGAKADPAAIKAALAEANKKATKCAKNGSLNISFTLNSSGKASGVSAVGGTFKGTPSEKCILTVFGNHHYPSFSGSSIPVKYTVRL